MLVRVTIRFKLIQMKKAIILIMICTLCQVCAKAQNAYYDSKEIDSLFRQYTAKDSSAAFQKYLIYFIQDNRTLDYARFFTLISPDLKEAAQDYLYGSKDTIIKICGCFKPTPNLRILDSVCNN